jgi:hypothetical protein
MLSFFKDFADNEPETIRDNGICMLCVEQLLPFEFMCVVLESLAFLHILLHSRQYNIRRELRIRTVKVNWWLCILYMKDLILSASFTLICLRTLLTHLHK